MPETAQKFFLTTPIYYVNARPHIGHAYTTIVADVLARRARAQGTETFFLTGTDEHGQKIERSAQAAGIPPQQFADQVSAEFRTLWDRMGLTYDKFIRTTDPAHKRGVQKLFRTLQQNGHIYLDSYTGAYCVSDETFVDVPAGAPCPDCGRATETVTEENYFFRLSAFQQPIIDLIESGKLTIEPDARRNEVLSFLRGGLKDLSISRSSFTWGIPVPADEQTATDQNHVIYVWLDALANYMTALGYGSDDESLWEKFWPADLHIVGKEIIRFHCVYWPAFLLAAGLPTPKKVVAHGWLLFEESKMSKSKGNIVRTETILDAFGTLCPTPPTLSSFAEGGGPASGSSPTHPKPVILSEGTGGSMPVPQSKDPEEASVTPSAETTLPQTPLAAEPSPHDRDLFASDVLRYFLLREIPFGQDGSFSFDALITRYNADLANGYGNLVSRTLTMIEKYTKGHVPNPKNVPSFVLFQQEFEGKASVFTLGNESLDINDFEKHFSHASGSQPDFVESAFLERKPIEVAVLSEERNFRYGRSLEFAWEIVAAADSHISFEKPWEIVKKPSTEAEEKLASVLYTAAESIRIFTALIYPILPYATANVWRQLGLGDIEVAAKNGELTNLQWGGLKPGTKLGPLSPIFPAPKKD